MILRKNENGGDCNTRPNLELAPAVHLDYLRIKINCREEELEEVFLLIEHEYLSVEMDSPWTAGKGCPYYKNKIVTPVGVSGGFTIEDETGDVELMIQFSGEYFSAISMVDSWRLILGLHHRFAADCCRIDIAIDDPTFSLIPVKEMRQAWLEKNNFRFQKHKVDGSGLSPEDYVETHYYGSRDSGKMVRVYNHDDECMRFEAEFKRGYAKILFLLIASLERGDQFSHTEDNLEQIDCLNALARCHEILGSSKEFSGQEMTYERLHGCGGNFDLLLQKILGSIAVSCIDFRNKSEQKDPSKASYRDTVRLDFYQEFMDKIGAEIRVKVPQRKSGIKNTVAWMQRSVAKFLAVVYDSLGTMDGHAWVHELISQGREKFTPADLKKTAFLKANKKILKLSNA